MKEDFDTTPYQLIINIRRHKIFKYTYDHRVRIYKSATYYGITRADTLLKLITKKFGKTPCQIEHEIDVCENSKENYINYCRELRVKGLIL